MQNSVQTSLTAGYYFLSYSGLQGDGAHLVVVVARYPEFASIQVERLLKLVHDTALPGPGEVGIVILHPEGRGVLLPV